MNRDNSRIVGLVALADLVLGLVLAAIGVVEDLLPLSIAGAVLLISSLGMLAWVTRVRDRPTVL